VEFKLSRLATDITVDSEALFEVNVMASTLQYSKKYFHFGRSSLYSSVSWLYKQIMGRLPLQYAATLKQSIRLSGKLDYANTDIFMVIDTPKSITRLNACHKEPETVEWLESCFRPGDVLYDIGANVGAYSFVAHAITRGECAIYAFEPSAATYLALSQNIILNNFGRRIFPLQIALSDETQLGTFRLSSTVPGAARHELIHEYSSMSNTSTMPMIQTILSYRLDDLIQQFALRHPTHIKLDVDGSELQILQGAGNTLEHPTLRSFLVEVDEIKFPDGQVIELLKSKGFQVLSRHPRGKPHLANYILARTNLVTEE